MNIMDSFFFFVKWNISFCFWYIFRYLNNIKVKGGSKKNLDSLVK